MNKYEIILDVCETKSISRTAEKLNYTQSAISQTIKAYETELGMKLFNRSKKGMELREEAEEVIESLSNICREERRISEIAASLASLESGDLRIGSIQSISYTWLPEIMQLFTTAYPNINYTLTIDGFQNLYRMFRANELDCMFTSQYAAPNGPFEELYRDELVLVAPQNHRLAEKLMVNIEDLDGEPFILSSDGLEYETGEILRMNEVVPDIRMRLNDDFTVAKLIEQQFGVSVESNLLMSKAPFDVCIRPFKARYYRTLGIAYPDRDKQARALCQFLESVRAWHESRK